MRTNLKRCFILLPLTEDWFRGYLVGKPTTGELVDINSRVPYAHGAGIISDELYQVIHRNCEGEDYDNPNPLNLLCTSALNTFDMFYSEINHAYTLDPKCPLASPHRKYAISARSLKETHSEFLQPPHVPDLNCRSYAYYLSYYWANNYRTREALHIKKGTVNEWVRCNHSLSYTKNVASSVIYHLNLTKKGYRALMYSGDKDLVLPFIGTKAWINSLNFPIVEEWRSWHVKGQAAGFAAAMRDMKVWVMNVVSIDSPDTLPITFERGLFGMYHTWCESFSTYPRTYDLLHADHLFSSIKKRCKLLPVITEVDRILRPEGKLIVRDNVETINEVENMAKSLHWEVRLTYSKDNEGLLCVKKTMWRPEEVEASM